MDSSPLSEFLCSPRPWIRTWRTGSPGSQCRRIWAELSSSPPMSPCYMAAPALVIRICLVPPPLPYPQPGFCFHALLTKLHEGFDFLQCMPSKSSKTSSFSLPIPLPPTSWSAQFYCLLHRSLGTPGPGASHLPLNFGPSSPSREHCPWASRPPLSPAALSSAHSQSPAALFGSCPSCSLLQNGRSTPNVLEGL